MIENQVLIFVEGHFSPKIFKKATFMAKCFIAEDRSGGS
jgi:hypothetical protein